MQLHELDNVMVERLAAERGFMRSLFNKARVDSDFRASESFHLHATDTDDTFFFPLNWISNGAPEEFCRSLGYDYETLSHGTPAQKLALRMQLLDTLLSDYRVNPPPDREFDVFVSHASEDKDSFVRPLVEELIALQLRVWYDEFELSVGDSLRRSIDRGISKSKYGIVVLSPAFLAKNWTQYELDGLVARQVNGNKVILPVWYDLTHKDVLEFSPSLADKYALDASKMDLAEIAMHINGVVRGRPKHT